MRSLYPFALVASICFSGTAAADALIRPAPLAPGIESLPRLAGDGPAALRINAGLEAVDRRILDDALACRALPGSWWERDVAITFTGPGFLSLNALNDLYCAGAAHPGSFLETPTYDLTTGAHVDWRRMLPADLLYPQTRRHDLAVVKGSPRLVALYLRANPTAPADCRAEIMANVEYFRLWLDAGDRGLVLTPDDLAHSMRACADPVVLSVPALVRIRVSSVMTDALTNAERTVP